MKDDATKDQPAPVMRAPYNLMRDAFSLMQSEPFYARIFAKIDKVASLAIPTAGVRFNRDKLRFELVYNPRFLGSLDRAARIDVLKHEGAHIFLDHCTTRTVAAELHRYWNIATDLAINSYLENLPEGCCMPGVGPFAEYPPYKSAEWYFNKMRDEGEPGKEPDEGDDEGGKGDPCENGDPGDGDQEGDQEGSNEGEGSGNGPGEPTDDDQDGSGGSGGDCDGGEPTDGSGGSGGGGIEDYQFDSHEGWATEEEISEAEREVARERLREVVRDAIEECDGGSGWGSVHAPMRDELRKNFKRQTINWRSVLRMFVQSSQPNKRRSSIRRLSKRYPWIHPGRRTDRVANIAISIDQSGSVSSLELEEFYNELEGLAKIATFTVIPFDDQVFEDGIEEWKKGQAKAWKRWTCGGTNFDAPTDYVNDHKEFDAHICMTDMCAPKPKSSRVPRLWVASERNARHPYFQPNPSERILPITLDT